MPCQQLFLAESALRVALAVRAKECPQRGQLRALALFTNMSHLKSDLIGLNRIKIGLNRTLSSFLKRDFTSLTAMFFLDGSKYAIIFTKPVAQTHSAHSRRQLSRSSLGARQWVCQLILG